MKTMSRPLFHAAAFAAGLVPLTAYSQSSDERPTIQPVTFALTETYEAPALAPKDEEGKVIKGEDPVWENEYSVETYKGEDLVKDVYTYEYGSKMLTYKISNKEILTDLMNEGVIDSIAGYSISFVSEDGGDGGENGGANGFYITKKGEAPIHIDDYLSVDDEYGADVATDSYKEVETYDYTKDTETYSVTGKGNGKTLVGVYYETSAYSVYMQGVATWSDSLKSFGKGEDQFYAWIPSSGKVSAITGDLDESGDDEFDNEDEYEDNSLIEGSISLGAGSLFESSL